MALRSPSQLGIATSLAADDVILGISGGINFGIEFSHLVDAVGTLDAGPSLPGTAANPGVEVGSATVGLFSGGTGATEFLGLAANGVEYLRVTGTGVTVVGGSDVVIKIGSTDRYDYTPTGLRIQLAGVSVAARGPLDIVTAGNANSLRVDETTGNAGFGAAPIVGWQAYCATSSSGAILGQTTSGYGVFGDATVGTGVSGNATSGVANRGDALTNGTGVLGTSNTGTSGYFITTHGRPLLAYQAGSLTGNNTNPCALIQRDVTLGAFDASGSLLQIVDTTASTGSLLQITKQGVSKFTIDNTGQTIYHWYDGSNYSFHSTGSTGQLTIGTAGSSNGITFSPGAETVSIRAAGLRVETGITAHARSLVDVVAAGNANAFRIDDTLGTAAFGGAPSGSAQAYAYSASGIISFYGQEASGIGVCGLASTGIGVKAIASGAGGKALHAESNAAAAVEVVKLVQLDDNEPFIEYTGTSAADATKSISTLTVATIAGYTRDSVNGTDVWRPYYNAPTA